jgi:putative addiction module component (TIGR02574 family)
MNKILRAELLELSTAERIQLAADLWDSIDPEDLPELTSEQIEAIEREWAEHQKDPSSAVSWDEVRSQLWARNK